MRHPMTAKPQIGLGRRHEDYPVSKKNKAVQQAQTANLNKVPVYIPELKMTIYVAPGTDIEAVKKKHMEMKEWRSKRLN